MDYTLPMIRILVDDSILQEVEEQLHFDSLGLGINHNELLSESLIEMLGMETERLELKWNQRTDGLN